MTVKRRGCTVETRKNILKDIQDWAEDPNSTRVYWMSGMAGTGKTTILFSLCEWLSKKRRLGANYFCSRISASCRDVNTIVPTLAYQLARYSPAFRSTLCKVLEENPEASKLDVKWQFEKLLQVPMQAVETAMPEGVVVVIDALDECDDGDAFRLFLETLLKLAVDLPIKFLVTSRPEPAIREKMLAPGYSRSVLHLHDIEEWIVEGDIKMYLTEALGPMSPPPSSNDVECLAKRAGKLFIYAATAVRYIHPGDPGVNSNARLRTMLRMDSRSTKQHDELNELYTNILSAAVDPNHLEEKEMNDIWLTLRTVVCAKEPMSVETLASLLSLTEEDVRFSLEPLRSILHVQDSTYGLVSPFHASFPDYLFDKLRSGSFHCEVTKHSEVLANFCFDLMKGQLRFNICKLESSFVFDEDVLDLQDRIKKFISPALSYACRYWGEHLREGNFTDTVNEKLVEFLTHRLLFWMEVLNLERGMVIGTDMLRQVQTWLKVREHGRNLGVETEIK
jgi:nucleoside-triphosphatase THEP1